jgi:hypothetical protein
LKRTSADSTMHASESIQWNRRDATRLTNGIVELISLKGGGHLASFRFLAQDGRASENVFWEAPWVTRDPDQSWSEDLSRMYGSEEIGRFLAGYTGHALCVDYFGSPSPESESSGLTLHGEAAIRQWRTVESANSKKIGCRWSVRLPVKQLTFEREIYLEEGQSVAYVQETVSNERDTEHRCDWVQHATFGPPFLREGESTLAASALLGITWPSSYENGSLLAPDRQFKWPFAPREGAYGVADLRQPFSVNGQGFIAGMQLDTGREHEFVVAVNWTSRLGVGYCFRRCDFAWMTVWEENHTRQNAPWNGTVAARGMEFGTTPLPLGEEANKDCRLIFDSPTGCVLPAHGTKTAKYLIFLFSLPPRVRAIQDVVVIGDFIVLYDDHGELALSIPADGAEAFMAQESASTK